MERRLPILPTLAAVYRDWRRLLFPLRTILISALLIVLAIAAVAELVPHRLWDAELSGAALGLVEDAVRAFLLTPIVIAIHRFVVLGEVASGYVLDVGEPAFWRFAGWLLALKVIAGLPYELLGLVQARGFSIWATLLVLVVALIVAIAVSLRLSVLFPAIAVETPGATAPNAFADTKGQALRLLAIFVLALLPWFVAVMAVIVLLGPERGHQRLGAGDGRPRRGRHRANRRGFALGGHRGARVHVPCRTSQTCRALTSQIPRSRELDDHALFIPHAVWRRRQQRLRTQDLRLHAAHRRAVHA